MIRTALVSAAVLALALGAGTATARERPTGEQELAKLLEGRVAGDPQSCVDTFRNRETRVVDGTALVVGRGRTIWVNIPHNAADLNDDDVLVTQQLGTQLCRQDIVRLVDRYVGFQTGAVYLDRFVPYTRAD